MADAPKATKPRTRNTRKTAARKAPPKAESSGAATLEDEELRHLRGCPAAGDVIGEEGSRVERHTSTRPQDGVPLEITRCVQCGEQVENELE